MSELKPCVMCGGEHRKLMGYDIHKVSCKDGNCPMSHLALTPEQWNTRAADYQLTTITKQRDELAHLVSQVRDFMWKTMHTDFDWLSSESRKIYNNSNNILSIIKSQQDSN